MFSSRVRFLCFAAAAGGVLPLMGRAQSRLDAGDPGSDVVALPEFSVTATS